MKQQRYDNVSKHIIFKYPQSIAKLAFGGENFEVEVILATEQITIKAGYTDITLKVKRPDGTLAILHIEVQTHDSEEPMPFRMASYHGFLLSGLLSK
jgi:hypothetical protein